MTHLTDTTTDPPPERRAARTRRQRLFAGRLRAATSDRAPSSTGRRRLLPVVAALAMVPWGASAGLAPAAPGDLDTSYGLGTGTSLADFGGTDGARAVALQPDGKIIVAGTSNANGTNDFAVARLLNPQGTFDPSYGLGSARSLADFGGEDIADAIALQPDGTIVVAGTSDANGTYDFAVARLLNPQGTFDPSYGLGTGRSLADFGGREAGHALGLQPDGGIIVAGRSIRGPSFDFAVARLLNPEGTFDPSYGLGTGRSLPDFGDVDVGEAMALQPDGRIVVAGTSNANGTRDFAVTRLLNPQGTFDPSYGLGSARSLADLGGADVGQAVALQPDGKIIVAGTTDANGTSDFGVVRLLNPQGTFDGSFGSGGRSIVNLGGADAAVAMALQPDGKIIIAGSTDAKGTSDFAVVRLQPSGVLDTTFGDGGRSIVNLGGADVVEAVALQPDGRIIVVGSSNANGTSDFAVARLQGDPGGGIAGGPGGSAGGSGSPPKCAGVRATIVGTPGPDTLTGTRRRDVIVALGGRDSIRGLGGADRICAGAGDDRVNAGGGDDRVLGGAGRDRLLGGPGRDRLLGGPGRDRLLGGAGRDRLLGGPGADRQRQ